MFHTTVAHTFLSAIVYQVVQSQLIDISQSVALWNIHAHAATALQSYIVVHDDVGATAVFLNARIGQPETRSARYVALKSLAYNTRA